MTVDIITPLDRATNSYLESSKQYAKRFSLFHLLSPFRFAQFILQIGYVFLQLIIVLLYKPPPPKVTGPLKNPRGRIAVIGAGLTGISSAAHAIAHGFEVVIYEANDRTGGIWSHVNRTSGLQLNSLLYRFHPAILWSRAFPQRDEILAEISKIWKEYKLESRTKFNTPVTRVARAEANYSDVDPNTDGHARWVINDGSDGVFDSIIINVGTCGDPRWAHYPGMPSGGKAQTNGSNEGKSYVDAIKSGQDAESSSEGEKHDGEEEVFEGPVIHSSKLDEVGLEGKTVLVVGSGASGVEAVETALAKGAQKAIIIARSDKWIIPRNILIDTSLSAQPFGRQTPLSFIWEWFIAHWNYHGVKDLVPAHKGIFEGTPVVNDEFLNHVREGRCVYIRGDTKRFTPGGVLVNVRSRESKPKERGEEKEFKGDIIVLATGFDQPKVDFLPSDLFPEGYERPNLYLQNFSTEDWSVLMTNSAYVNAIVVIYTRILLTLLMDKDARPTKKDMKLWVDVIRFIKKGAAGGALGFFTYMELTIWILLFHVLRPDRLKWLLFILFGWGVHAQ